MSVKNRKFRSLWRGEEYDFSLIEQHVKMMVNHIEDYKWLYEHLQDYRL